MHLFLDNSENSKLIQLIIEFLQLERFNKLKISIVEDFVKNSEMFNLSVTPILFLENGENLISVTKILEHFVTLTNLESVLNPQSEISKYFDLISQNSKKDLLNIIEERLESRTFLESDSNLTFADLIIYISLIDEIKDYDDTEKYIFNDVFRWITHIQNLPSIKRVIEKLNLLTISRIDLSKVVMKKVKKVKK